MDRGWNTVFEDIEEQMRLIEENAIRQDREAGLNWETFSYSIHTGHFDELLERVPRHLWTKKQFGTNGKTLLHYASGDDINIASVRKLIEVGCDVNGRYKCFRVDRYDNITLHPEYTPVMAAAGSGSPLNLQTLLDVGGRIQKYELQAAIIECGRPGYNCALERAIECAKILLKHGASLSNVSPQYWDALPDNIKSIILSK